MYFYISPKDELKLDLSNVLDLIDFDIYNWPIKLDKSVYGSYSFMF